jgi:hypothetical protein
MAAIRLGSWESARAFKGIICDDISEFESHMPSQAVGLHAQRVKNGRISGTRDDAGRWPRDQKVIRTLVGRGQGDSHAGRSRPAACLPSSRLPPARTALRFARCGRIKCYLVAARRPTSNNPHHQQYECLHCPSLPRLKDCPRPSMMASMRGPVPALDLLSGKSGGELGFAHSSEIVVSAHCLLREACTLSFWRLL